MRTELHKQQSKQVISHMVKNSSPTSFKDDIATRNNRRLSLGGNVHVLSNG